MNLALKFHTDPAADASWSKLREAVYEAVASVGIKEVAYRLDVAPSLLSDALNERDRKNLQLKWLPVILSLVSDAHRAAILSALGNVCGYEMTRRKVLTAEERLERLEQAVRAKLGKIGAELIAEVGQ